MTQLEESLAARRELEAHVSGSAPPDPRGPAPRHRFRIVTPPDRRARGTVILLDGQRLRGVRGYTIAAHVAGEQEISISFLAAEIDLGPERG